MDNSQKIKKIMDDIDKDIEEAKINNPVSKNSLSLIKICIKY